jgi:hypothetical protein
MAGNYPCEKERLAMAYFSHDLSMAVPSALQRFGRQG